MKVKILLQRLWESKVDWDDPVPKPIEDVWSQWHYQLKFLSQIHIPRYYFPKDVQVASLQQHGFCDASENAYSSVVYVRMVDTIGGIQVALVASITRVAPLSSSTYPSQDSSYVEHFCLSSCLTMLEPLCRYQLKISQLGQIAQLSLDGSPCRFKTYVSNRIYHQSCSLEELESCEG